MVGMARFERATPASRTQCPTKLGHIPTHALHNQFEMNCPSFFSAHGKKREILVSPQRMQPKKVSVACFLQEDPVCVFGIDMVGAHRESISGGKFVIIYDLECRDGHKFEGWFKDRGAFEEQKAQKLIACPVCGNTEAVLIPSSVAILGRDNRSAAVKTKTGPSPQKVLREFHEYIRKNFDNVGDKFAEVALRIHHGEEDGRNIRGTTTGSEEETLREEGIQFIKIPLPKFDG